MHHVSPVKDLANEITKESISSLAHRSFLDLRKWRRLTELSSFDLLHVVVQYEGCQSGNEHRSGHSGYPLFTHTIPTFQIWIS